MEYIIARTVKPWNTIEYWSTRPNYTFALLTTWGIRPDCEMEHSPRLCTRPAVAPLREHFVHCLNVLFTSNTNESQGASSRSNIA